MSAPTDPAPFHHVLCWVDGSDEACAAAGRAVRLAAELGARLSFLALGAQADHDEGFEAYARIEGISEPLSSVIDPAAAACLDQAIAIAARAGVEGAGRLTRVGDPVEAICDTARIEGADLVVIRKHRAGLAERLFGRSVSDALSHQCTFAVLSDG